MAIVTRKYLRVGTNDAQLTKSVASSAAVNTAFTNLVEIDIDDAVSGILVTLDQYMAERGFVFSPASTGVDVDAHGARHTGAGGDAVPNVTIAVSGLMSAPDKVKLDGIAAGATATPLTATPPVDVTKATAAIGVSTEAARADHKHDIATANPNSITFGVASTQGTSSSLARADHVHGINNPVVPANVTKLAALPGVSNTPAREDHKHDITTAIAVGITDSTNAEGSGSALSRSDHIHAHGDRGGGTLHAVVIASGAAGFMSGADKAKLDGIPAGGGSFGVSGQKVIRPFGIGGRESNDSATPLIVGAVSFDPDDHLITGTTLTITFRAVVANGNTPLTTRVKLRNVTDAVDVVTLDVVDTTALVKVESGSLALPSGAKIYECQIFVVAPSVAADTIELHSAELRVTNTIT